MKSLMLRLSGFLSRRRWLVLAAWIAVVIAALPLAARQTEDLIGGGFEVPNSQSQVVEDALSNDFDPGRTGGIGAVLTAGDNATPQQINAGVDRLKDTIAKHHELTLSPKVIAATRTELEHGDVAVVALGSALPSSDLSDVATDLRDELHPGTADDNVTPYLIGQPAAYAGLQELSKQDLADAEHSGFPIVALILLAVFGSAAAASLPLALGAVAVTVTGALIFLLSQEMEMSVFVTNMASMIGIGVAVDYSLFILARFREEVRAGATAEQARATALATSGLAVTFSGLAVVISLAGLWMVHNQALRSMALGAMVVVAVAVLVATTLLPVLIRLLGHRVEAGGVTLKVLNAIRHPFTRRRRRGSTNPDRADNAFWARWTAAVMRRPWISAGSVTLVLLVLAIPVLSMKTGASAIKQFPAGHDVRVGNDLAQKASGGGANPVEILVRFDHGDLSDPANKAAIDEFSQQAKQDPGVASIATAKQGRNGAALIDLQSRDVSESQNAMDLINRLRSNVVPGSSLAKLATVSVGGESARTQDVRAQIRGSMWKILAFVLGFSFLALMLMLRSVVLPLKAILMNLLSIGAAYGVLVIVFQWGWFDGFGGFQSPGSLDTINPPLILAVVFGLSMDYEVFLLSRIKEHYTEHGDNKRAVAEGLSSSARTISSAAVIMTCVFSIFVLTGVASIKELGLGNAVAIALDASLVRLILVPAAMQLMGDWNWWLPGWLDRILPDIGLETAPDHEEAKQPAIDPAPAGVSA